MIGTYAEKNNRRTTGFFVDYKLSYPHLMHDQFRFHCRERPLLGQAMMASTNKNPFQQMIFKTYKITVY